MLTKEEYKKELTRMWDSLRETNKGEHTCLGVLCNKCPFNELCNDYKISIESGKYAAFEVIKTVEHWAKKHPLVTNADKFKEVFGVEPRTPYDMSSYICPGLCVGKSESECKNARCADCKKAFWQAEYKEPKKSEVG